MANYNLTNQTISSSFEQLLQKDTDTGNLVDGLGNNIDSLDIDGTVSSSFIGDGSGLTNLPTQTLPSGVVSGSEQIDYPLISNIPSGIISSSEQLPSGIISSSEQLPSGLVSGSSQVSYPELSNIPSGIVSSSSQVVLEDTTFTDGDVNSFLQTDGAGNLSFQYVKSMYEEIKNRESFEIQKGQALFVDDNTGDRVDVYLADSTNPNRFPATLIASENISPNGNGLGLISGLIANLDVGTLQSGDIVYLGTNGGWTATRPTGSADIQVLGVVSRPGNNGAGYFINQLHTTLPNIPQGQAWVGDSNGVPQSVSTASWDEKTDITQLNLFTESIQTEVDGLSDETSSYARIDTDNIFTGNQTFNNLTVNGTGSFAYIESVTGSAKIIGDAFIVLNNNTPTERYAGVAVYDSGSAGVTASFQFDGESNDWFYEYSDDGGVTTEHGVVMFGPEYSDIGTPTYPSNNTIQKGDGGHHLLDSNITDDGTTISFGNNIKVDGDLKVTNSSKVEVELGSSVNFYEDGSALNTSGLRFHSGSDSTGTKWINMQPEPGGEGRMAIASFPENNHFMFFDPKDSQLDNQRLYIESIIEGGSRGGVVRIGQGLEVTGSLTNNGDTTIVGTNLGPGNTFQAYDGNGTPILSVQNSTLKVFTDIDVVVNGNTAFDGTVNITGDTTIGSNLENTGSFTNGGDTIIVGTNLAPGTTFQAKDGNNIPRITVNNATLSGLLGEDVNLNGNTTIGGALTITDNTTINGNLENTGSFTNNGDTNVIGTNIIPGSTFNVEDGTGTTRLTVQNATLGGLTGVDVIINGNTIFDGTIRHSGSVETEVQPLSISTLQSTIDFSQTSLFELTLGEGVDTEILATNVGVGQTVNVLITQNATTAGNVSFSSDFLQPDGSEYVPTDTLGGQDILTLMTYNDTSKIYVVATNKFV